MKTNVQPVLLLTSLTISYLFELVSDGHPALFSQPSDQLAVCTQTPPAARADLDLATVDGIGRVRPPIPSSIPAGYSKLVRLRIRNVLLMKGKHRGRRRRFEPSTVHLVFGTFSPSKCFVDRLIGVSSCLAGRFSLFLCRSNFLSAIDLGVGVSLRNDYVENILSLRALMTISLMN